VNYLQVQLVAHRLSLLDPPYPKSRHVSRLQVAIDTRGGSRSASFVHAQSMVNVNVLSSCLMLVSPPKSPKLLECCRLELVQE
jgi:hypothetical protein